VGRFAGWSWDEEQKKAVLEALRRRRTATQAQPQDGSNKAIMRALDEVIAELEQEPAAE
jgi:hypothetical protein